MRDFLESLVQAVRVLRRAPGFTLSALAVLTLGIGANTAIFSVVNTVLLRPLPFPDSGSIMTVYHSPPAIAFPGITTFPASPANYLDWRKQNDVFESMAAFNRRGFRVGGGTRPETLLATLTDAGFFQVLRGRPAVGRVFTEDEDQPGRDAVVVLSDGFATRHFGSQAEALGKRLDLNGRSVEVIGVMPADFSVTSWAATAVDGWVPAAWNEETRAGRRNHSWVVVARLRDGVSPARAQAAMDVISDRLARDYPEEDKGWGAKVIPLRDFLVGDVRPALLLLLGAVGFVLLIACANTGNLVLARTIARRKELAIRTALGASARQVLRPILVETVLLALAGGALGLLVAGAGQSLVMKALASQLPRATEVQIDGWVLAFTLAASLLTGLGAGFLAGARLLGGDLNDSLKQGMGKSNSDGGGRTTRNALVISEVALSLMLLVGAGLMIRTFLGLQGTDPGFHPANVLTVTVPIVRSSDEPGNSTRFYYEFLPQVAALPGVRSVAAIDNLPLQGGSEQPIVIEGRPAEVFALQRNVSVRSPTPNYFRTMGIPMFAGRDFELKDTEGKERVGIISQAMANLFWPGENAVGKRFRISFSPDVVRTVVGVVGDIKDRGLKSPESVAMLYLPIEQDDSGLVRVVVRGDGRENSDVARLAPAISGVLSKLDARLTVREIRTMEERVAASLSEQQFTMWLLAALAGLAILLASVGIYSVLAYSVRGRAREIGVRMALGARAGDVLRLVLSEGMKPTLIGIVIGAGGALALGDMLTKLVYGVSPSDPLTFLSVVVVLVLVAAAACAIPAYRATRVQPVTALRSE